MTKNVNFLQRSIAVANAKLERSAKLTRRAEKLKKEADESLDAIRKKIISEETSFGDGIKNFTIIQHSLPEQAKFESDYRTLQARLAQLQGQYLMVVRKKGENTRYGLPCGFADIYSDLELAIGVIYGYKLVFRIVSDEYIIPTQLYFPIGDKCVFLPNRCDKDINIEDKEISIDSLAGWRTEFDSNSLDWGNYILLGDEEVSKWFDRYQKNYLLILCLANAVFKRSLQFPNLVEFFSNLEKKLKDELELLVSDKTALEAHLRIKYEGVHIETERKINTISKKIDLILNSANKIGASIVSA